MPATTSDKNLLFGILALQMDFITRDQLVAAMNAWVLEKSKFLGQILHDQKSLKDDELALLEGVVSKHVEKHGGDIERSLAAIDAEGSLVRQMSRIGDADLDRSISFVSTSQPSDTPAPVGRTVTYEPAAGDGKSRFHILRPHARGGLGEVFVAFDEEVGREVALKEIQAEHLGRGDIEARFRFEGEVTGRLEHPGVVPIYGMGRYADGRPYYAMRFVEGENLKEAIARFHDPGRKLSARERSLEMRGLLRRFIDVCNVIEYAHSRGVIHRDIKPSNILLGKFGETLVVDWGLAKAIGMEDEAEREEPPEVIQPTSESRVFDTRTGKALGTPGFMSPEQAGGRTKEVGPASDVFSLGATLYMMLTGRYAFPGDNAAEVLRRVQAREFQPPRSVQSDLPHPLDAICVKAMAHDADKRYASAKTLAADIEAWLADERVSAHREPALSRLGRWGRRHRTAVAASFVLLIATVVSLAVGSIALSGANRATERALREKSGALDIARNATVGAEVALAEKSKALALAKRQADELRRNLYFDRIRQATQFAEERNSILAKDMLASIEADPAISPLRNFEWGYLQNKIDRELRSFQASYGPVTSVSFIPDGSHLVTGGEDGTVRLWDSGTGKEMRTLNGHVGFVVSVSVSPDGARLASAGEDRTVRIWDITTGKELQKLHNSGYVRHVSFGPDGTRLASVCQDETVRLWDTSTGTEIQKLEELAGSVLGLSVGPDGALIVSANDDGSFQLWDGSTAKVLQRFKGHKRPVLSVQFSHDKSRLASASEDGTVRLWDTVTGTELLKLVGHTGSVRNVSFSPDSVHLVSTGDDGIVRLWETATGKELKKLHGHSRRVLCASFTRDGTRLASAGDDGTVRLWDVATGTELRKLQGHAGYVGGVSFSPDGSCLASSGLDGKIRLWNAVTGRQLREFAGHLGYARSVSFSLNGMCLASCGFDGTIRLWDAVTGQQLMKIQGPSRGIRTVRFSPNGARLASGDDDGNVHLWDAVTGRQLRKFHGHSREVQSISFSPDGTRIASAGSDGKVRVWDTEAERELYTLQGDSRSVLGVSFSPDGTRVASAGDDGTVRLWDAATGKELHRIEGTNRESVASLSFSPDGACLVSGGQKGTVCLWDVTTGKELQKLHGHSRYVASVSFSPDGTRLVSAGDDGAVRLWGAAMGKEVQTLMRGVSPNLSVSFSPDGSRLASASEDGTIHLWDTATGMELRKLLGHSSVRSLSFSPDGARLALACRDGAVRLLEIRSGREYVSTRHWPFLRSVSFSPDGTRLALACGDGTVGLMETASGRDHVFQGHRAYLRSVSFSPDGARLASAGGDGMILIWDTDSGKVLQKLLHHSEFVSSVSFRPDGAQLASADSDGTVRLWDTGNGNEVRTLMGHSGHVISVRFSPDGARLASAGEDGMVRIWDASTGKELQKLQGHSGYIESVSFSPDGARLASAGADGTIRIWNGQPVTDEYLIAKDFILNLLNRFLSKAEIEAELTKRIGDDQALLLEAKAHIDRLWGDASFRDGYGLHLAEAAVEANDLVKARRILDSISHGSLDENQTLLLVDLLGIVGNWSRAAEEFNKSLFGSNMHWSQLQRLACLHLAAGNAPEYQRLCHLLLADKKITNANQALWTALTCAIGEKAIDTPESVVAIVETALHSDGQDVKLLGRATLGMAQYRAGKLEESLGSLRLALSLAAAGQIAQPKMKPVLLMVQTTCWAILARIHHDRSEVEHEKLAIHKTRKLLAELDAIGPTAMDVMPGKPRWTIPFAVEMSRQELAKLDAAVGAPPAKPRAEPDQTK